MLANSYDKDTIEIFQNTIARTSAFTAQKDGITVTHSVYEKIFFSKVKHLCITISV